MATTTGNSTLTKVAKGAGWIIGWRMATRILGLASTLFLVRLLLPSDFGLVTIATGFGQAIDALSALGVEEAVIREKEPSRELYDSAFTINIIRGLATGAILLLSAWPVAVFFSDMRLVPVMAILAGCSLVGACENIGIVDFRRDIAFEREFLLMLVPRIASTLTAVGLAYAFRSYWALMAAISLSSIVRVAMGYVLHPFRPRLGLRAWRQIAHFSFWSWLLSLTSLARDRCDTFVIGRVLGITQVGTFSVGVEIASLPATELVSPLARASFSGFAAARNSGTDADAAQTFMRVLSSAALLSFPAGVGISLMAEPIVKLAFGSRWLGATAVIEVLGIGLLILVLGLISASLLNAYGMLRGMFMVQLAAVAARIPLVTVLVMYMGLPGAAIGALAGAAVEHALYLLMALRRLHLTLADLLRHTWRCPAAAGAMAIALRSTGLGWSRTPDEPALLAASLLAAVPFGAAVYGIAVAALWLAAGSPQGAERDALDVIRRLCRQAVDVVRKQWGAIHGHS